MRAVGCVPRTKNSLRVSRVHGPGFPPDQASIVAVTTLLGRWNLAIGHFFEYSSTNACHSGAAALIDVAGSRERGSEWSLLPIQIPTTSPGLSLSFGGAR